MVILSCGNDRSISVHSVNFCNTIECVSVSGCSKAFRVDEAAAAVPRFGGGGRRRMGCAWAVRWSVAREAMRAFFISTRCSISMCQLGKTFERFSEDKEENAGGSVHRGKKRGDTVEAEGKPLEVVPLPGCALPSDKRRAAWLSMLLLGLVLETITLPPTGRLPPTTGLPPPDPATMTLPPKDDGWSLGDPIDAGTSCLSFGLMPLDHRLNFSPRGERFRREKGDVDRASFRLAGVLLSYVLAGSVNEVSPAGPPIPPVDPLPTVADVTPPMATDPLVEAVVAVIGVDDADAEDVEVDAPPPLGPVLAPPAPPDIVMLPEAIIPVVPRAKNAADSSAGDIGVWALDNVDTVSLSMYFSCSLAIFLMNSGAVVGSRGRNRKGAVAMAGSSAHSSSVAR